MGWHFGVTSTQVVLTFEVGYGTPRVVFTVKPGLILMPEHFTTNMLTMKRSNLIIPTKSKLWFRVRVRKKTNTYFSTYKTNCNIM